MNTSVQELELQYEQITFLKSYKRLGFENENALIRFAIKYLQNQIKRQDERVVQAFTNLFMEIYEMEPMIRN